MVDNQPQRPTSSRKSEHIRLNLDGPVQGGLQTGFERFHFVPDALPEVDLEQVSTATSFVGRSLRAPVLISCMTGGVEQAEVINQVLARTAERHGFALGLGSGRILLEDPHAPGFAVRALAPSVPLLANLGAPQLLAGAGVEGARRLVDLTEADALVIHLNAMQEAVQPEGEPRYAGLLAAIEDLCRRLEAPVVVKEVGAGVAGDTVQRLFAAGVHAVDVAGAGGTSWTEVERRRLRGTAERVAAAFAGWGIPTADALLQALAVAGGRPVIASGGIRDGMDVAKAIGLGAHLAGLAGSFLRAAAAGEEAASDLAEELVGVLRRVMFGVGARDLEGFRSRPRLRPEGEPPGRR